MAATSTHLHLLLSPLSLSSQSSHRKTPIFFKPPPFYRKIRVFHSTLSINRRGIQTCSICLCRANSQIEKVEAVDEIERPPFDINLAVLLAGFAFEAYTTPPENVGRREVDAADCATVYLSESFVREIYDGQLFIKLKKGYSFPAMDPWGTCDPYVVMQFDSQVVKSKIKWGTKDPTWNEELAIQIKLPPSMPLQVAAWDANLVTPHKRMGNAGVNLEDLCDGNLHELLVDLEGMGGGGRIQLEVKFRSFGEIDKDKKWWQIPFLSEFLSKNNFDSAIKMLAGSESVSASQFVQYAFSQLKSLNETYAPKDWLPSTAKQDKKSGEESYKYSELDAVPSENIPEGSSDYPKSNDGGIVKEFLSNDLREATQSSKHFWKKFADSINQKVVQRLGIPVPDKMRWDEFDIIKKTGFDSQQAAEAGYIESGVAIPESQDSNGYKSAEGSLFNIVKIQSSLPDIKKATEDILRQTDSVFSALMVLAAAVPQLKKDTEDEEHSESKQDSSMREDGVINFLKSDGLEGLDETRAEEMRELFSTAETAMEAWAMLATSLGHPSLIKSEFEKICFLDNSSTDTQVQV